MLKGQTALITGAGSGIGRATCQILAKEGANIIATDLNFETCKETLTLIDNNVQKLAINMDVSDKKAIENALELSLKEFKTPPNIIVNCAGIYLGESSIIDMCEERIQLILDVNLKGTLYVLQVFAKELIKNKMGGSVINISSVLGATVHAGMGDYCITKSGVVTLTKVAAKDLGRHGIRVNAVLPGLTETPMIKDASLNFREKFTKLTPLGRICRPEEVAEVVLFLASPKNQYMTGSSVVVDGGFLS